MGKSRHFERGDKPQLDRFGTLNAFVDNTLAAVTKKTKSASAGLVWLALFRLADGTTGLVQRNRASERTLAKLTGLSKMTVRTALQALKDFELLTIEQESTYRVAPSYKLYHLEKGESERTNG